jgi:hypothetical protein
MSFNINGLRFNFRDFLVIKLRYSLPFNALHVNNSVDFLETRLRTCLCALSLSGLRLQSRLPSQFQPTQTGKSDRISLASAVRVRKLHDTFHVEYHHVASRQSREKISPCDRRAPMKNSPLRPPSKRFLTGLKTLFIDLNKLHYRVESTHEFPLRCILSRQPARTTLRFRSESFTHVSALRVCGQAPSRL